MPHFPGPYVNVPRQDPPGSGFAIYAVKLPLPVVMPHPIGIVPANRRDSKDVEDTARLFTAAPLMLLALQTLAKLDLDEDVLELINHTIKSATD